MKLVGKFEYDFRLLSEKFPKLNKFSWIEKLKSWVIEGELDICDMVGDYWDTFKVRVIVPINYPYCVPMVQEMSNKIPRQEDRHINELGFCCLDIDHRLLRMSRRGIRLNDFVTTYVYPYFANQIYYESEERYSSGEYAHHFAGVIQFYHEELGIRTAIEAITILEHILTTKPLGRNEPCFCGRGKYKSCHLQTVNYLKSVGKERLIRDLSGFKEVQQKVSA